MISLYKMNIIQIDITNACLRQCSNCTRFCGHHKKNFFMDLRTYKKAVDSLVDFPGMVGMIGGEPLLHPNFPEMVQYLRKKIDPPNRRGLWSSLPQKKSKKYSKIIKESFGNLYVNDHSRNDILHQPILVGAQEMIEDKEIMWSLIDKCWVQTMWSASITPKGTFFCEVAASFDMLFDGPGGWPIEPGWWQRNPQDFEKQKKLWCPMCGCAIPLKRRPSTDEIDDLSPKNLKMLQEIDSPKIKKNMYAIYDQGFEHNWEPDPNWYMSKISKEHEIEYRNRIKSRLEAL